MSINDVITGAMIGAGGIGIIIFVTIFICYGAYLFLKDMGIPKKICQVITVAIIIAEIIGGIYYAIGFRLR